MTLYKTVADKNGGKHVEMTAEEETDFVAAQSVNQSAQAISDLKSKAQSALDASDMTAIRCMKAGVSFPSEWRTYVNELRDIVNSGTGSIPNKPIYPQGT